MFGLRLRSWMEAHIVRPRKKQPPSTQPTSPPTAPERSPAGKGAVGGRGGCMANGRASGAGRVVLDASPTSPLDERGLPDGHHVARRGGYGANGAIGRGRSPGPPPTAHPPPPPGPGPAPPAGYSVGGTNLSSPESAYSTGYSTDGTSPGASFPPEYYINIRTGTHYFHSAPAPGAVAASAAVGRGSPRGRARVARVPGVVPEPIYAQPRIMRAATEDPAVSLAVAAANHRRTESCDARAVYAVSAASSPPPHGLVPAPAASAVAAGPAAASMAAASPRQRNRIRTNPWVGGNKGNAGCGGGSASTASGGNACGATSASQESSSSYGSGSDVTLPRASSPRPSPYAATPAVPPRATHSPALTPPAIAVVAPQETRSPRLGRGQWSATRVSAAAAVRRDSLCSSTSSSGGSRTPLHGSGCASGGAPSDDDLTLNEMLGRYDESYVYEKETDILSDSDPTDCDEEYGDEEALDADDDPEAPGRAGGDEEDVDDFDFIDTGMCAAAGEGAGAVASDSSCGAHPPNRGHCTYYPPLPPPGHCASPTPGHPERRPTLRGQRRPGSRRTHGSSGSPGPQRAASCRAERRGSSSRHRRAAAAAAAAAAGGDSSETTTPGEAPWSAPRAPSEKKRLRCSTRSRRAAAPPSLGSPAAPSSPLPPVGPIVPLCPLGPNGPLCPPLVPQGPLHSQRPPAEPLPLNRVLVQRMLARDTPGGTRSAGNTPVSLRRRLGEPPPPASRLAGPPPSTDTKGATVMPPALITLSPPGEARERRSNSLSGDPRAAAATGAAGASQPGVGATFASELALLQADQEAERKYRQLITDAEQILLGMRGAMLLQPRPKPFFMNARYLVDDARASTREGSDVSCITVSPGSPAGVRRVTANGPGSPRPDSPAPTSPAATRAAPPLQRRRSGSTSSSEGSSTPRHSDGAVSPPPAIRSPPSIANGPGCPAVSAVAAPAPPLMAFRSVDLGGGALEGYCPQSEPVKRKVYAGSASLDRLQKSLEKSQHQSLRLKADAEGASSEERSGAGSLQQKLADLRRERLQVEAKVREARDEERRRLDERAQAQRQLTLLRRQMLVHTIEGLKRSLEDQSARLHEAVYDPADTPPTTATLERIASE